jgi:hypothetical protein
MMFTVCLVLVLFVLYDDVMSFSVLVCLYCSGNGFPVIFYTVFSCLLYMLVSYGILYLFSVRYTRLNTL